MQPMWNSARINSLLKVTIGLLSLFFIFGLLWIALLEDIFFWSQSPGSLEETLEDKLTGTSVYHVLLFLGQHDVKDCRDSNTYGFVICTKRIQRVNHLDAFFSYVLYRLEFQFQDERLIQVTVTEESYDP